MGMNLSDFGSQILKDKIEQQNSNMHSKSNNQSNGKDFNSKESITEKFISMKNLSNNDLNSKLLEEVNKSKRDGTFDYQQLSKTVEGFKGMMPEESYNNLKRLLEQIK